MAYTPQAPGPQNPGKYRVPPGPNYQYWGEQQGFVYNPWQDAYTPDPREVEQWGYDTGLKEPEKKPPSVWEQAQLPLMVAAAVPAGAYLGEQVFTPAAKDVAGTLASDASGSLYSDVLKPIFKPTPTTPPTTPASNGLLGMNTPSATQVASNSPMAAQGGAGVGLMDLGRYTAAPGSYAGEGAIGAGVGGVGPEGVGAGLRGGPPGYGQAGGAYNWMGPIGLAAGAYGMAQAYESGDPLTGALSGGTAGAGLVGTMGLLGSPLTGTLLGMGPLGWAVGAGALLGALGGVFGDHETTKERQAKREKKLFDSSPGFQQYVATRQELGPSIDTMIQKANAATPEGYRGWWDNPETEGNDWIWVNKRTDGYIDSDAKIKDLGSGDVMWHPWFFENIPEWYNMTWEQRDAIAKKALEVGNPHGNAGHIDFNMNDTLSEFIQATKDNPPAQAATSPDAPIQQEGEGETSTQEGLPITSETPEESAAAAAAAEQQAAAAADNNPFNDEEEKKNG